MKKTTEFKMVECSGTAYEIGLQWGEGCRESFYQISENRFHSLELMYQAKKQLADANGVVLGIESTYNDYEIVQPKDNLMLHSNHYLTERFKHDDMMAYMAEMGYISPDMAIESFKRYERIHSLMYKDYGRITIQTAKKVLSDHENQPYSICRHDDKSPNPSVTLASFIMVPGEGAIYIAAGNPCEYEYVRYEF